MRIQTFAMALAACALLAGCSSRSYGNTLDTPSGKVVVMDHNAVSLYNYRIAREYSTAGRYELAREHYLLAYAAAENDGPLRERLHQELKAVDLMIKTLR